MSELLEAMANLELWQAAIIIIITVAGSSASSALITSAFTSKRESNSFRREARRAALEAIGKAYGSYLRYGNTSVATTVDDARDQMVAENSAMMHVAVAAIGDTALLPLSQKFAVLGELFASRNEETSITQVDDTFTELIEKISGQVPA